LARTLRLLALALAALALLAYVGYAAIYAGYAAALFRWPYDYDQGEGFELYDALLYARGEWPYREVESFPHYASNYPPLFHLLMVPLLPLTGPSLLAGRIISFLATLVTAATLGWMVRRELRTEVTPGAPYAWAISWFLPLTSALAYLASNYVYQTGPLARLHTTMVMFEALAIAFIARFEDPAHGRRNLLLALLFLLLAGYTKQMALFTVLAALTFVFLRDVKRALLAGAALALVTGLIFLALNLATDGQWWRHTIAANANVYDYLMTLSLFKQWFRLHPVLVTVAGAAFVYELIWGRLSAYALWFFFALGTGVLSGKWGAGSGYFITAVAATCVLTGLALGRLLLWLRGRPRLRAALALAVPLLYLAQAAFFLHLPTSGPLFGPLARALGVAGEPLLLGCRSYDYYDAIGYTQLGHRPTAADYEAGARIMAHVRAVEGPILSEEAAFSLLAGKPVVTNPTQLYNLYARDDVDLESLLLSIYRHDFDLIILRAQFYPEPVLGAIWFSYEPVESVCMNGFTYQILRPQP
jgi:hypothetical protein